MNTTDRHDRHDRRERQLHIPGCEPVAPQPPAEPAPQPGALLGFASYVLFRLKDPALRELDTIASHGPCGREGVCWFESLTDAQVTALRAWAARHAVELIPGRGTLPMSREDADGAVLDRETPR